MIAIPNYVVRFAGMIGLCALALPGVAEAYRYDGPRTARADCAGKVTCKFVNTDFGAIAFKTTLPLRVETTVAIFQPIHPTQRGGSFIDEVSLLVSRDGDNVILNIRRTYHTRNGLVSVDYPVTDPLQVGIDPDKDVALDLAIYMSADQAWIESQQGNTSLSRVWTIPMFFGFGPFTSGFWIDSYVPQASYFAVDKTILLHAINSNYASLKNYTPFLFRGRRIKAAGLLAAIDVGTR